MPRHLGGRQPNFVVIMTDEQKATACSLYGNPQVQTPHLEALAAQGILYRSAFTPHPLCVPARVSFWTGRYPHSHGSRTNEILLRPTETHFFDLLHDQGYTLGLVGKNHCFGAADLGLFQTVVDISHGGPAGPPTDPAVAEMAAFLRTPGRFASTVAAPTAPYPAAVSTTNLVADAAIRFLEQFRDQRLALWVSIPDPHTPFQAPEPYASRFPPESIELPPWKPDELEGKPERQRVLSRITGVAGYPLEDVRRLVGIYYAMIAQIDDAVGRILAAIDRLGLREGTIVVFVSDHGDFMGEHAMVEKGGTLYDALVRVPLILSWPRRLPEGRAQPELVNLVDVMPTLLGLAGLPIPPRTQGKPLPATGLPGADEPREAVFAEYGAGGPRVTLADLERRPPVPGQRTVMTFLRAREAEGRMKMVRTHRWKHVHDPLGDLDELYDLQADPWELTNLYGRPEYSEVVDEMRLRLLDWSVKTEDAEPVPLYF